MGQERQLLVDVGQLPKVGIHNKEMTAETGETFLEKEKPATLSLMLFGKSGW